MSICNISTDTQGVCNISRWVIISKNHQRYRVFVSSPHQWVFITSLEIPSISNISKQISICNAITWHLWQCQQYQSETWAGCPLHDQWVFVTSLPINRVLLTPVSTCNITNDRQYYLTSLTVPAISVCDLRRLSTFWPVSICNITTDTLSISNTSEYL